MMGEDERGVYRLLLKYLNTGKTDFENFEVATESDGAAFVFDDLATQMLEDKILKKVGEDRYEIIVGIGTFRNYVLKQTEKEREADGDQIVSIDTIMNSSWKMFECNAQKKCTGRLNDDSGRGGNSEGKSDKYRPEYLEERRRELINRMKTDIDDEDEDNDEEDDEDEDGDSMFGEYKESDELYKNALKFCIERGIVSAALIQRRFPIGYIRACKIIDWMENNQFISPPQMGGQRNILIDRDDYARFFGEPFYGKSAAAKMLEKDSVVGRYLKNRTREQEKRAAAQKLVNALSRVAEKKCAPVSCDDAPGWSLWVYEEFESAVIERLERIITSDRRMGRQGAVKKAETYLEAVRDTHDGKMAQVYARIVYELKSVSDNFYRRLKKDLCE